MAAAGPTTTRPARAGLLVLGGGFAGAYVARLAGRSGATIVSPENYMLYTPLLPEAASGTVEPRHAVVPLRVMCPHCELLLGRATALDVAAREVTVETDVGTASVTYERLVVALGAIPRTLPIPGLAEHGMAFKTLADAIALRNHVLRRLDTAVAEPTRAGAERQLSFVFVGAGYAGVEALAELHDLVRDALRRYPELRDHPQRWLLVDAGASILPETAPTLSAYAARLLMRRGIEVLPSTTLTSAIDGHVVLSSGIEVDAATLVWTAGVRANPVASLLGLPLDDRGRIVVDEELRVQDADRIWALGDGASVPNAATPGAVDPPTCQHALRQARRLAGNLRLVKRGKPARRYSYRTLGAAATLGRYRGIAQVPGLRLSGFPGWFFTRTYHLYQLPLVTRRLRVVADWTVALFFRRDIAELGSLSQPERLGEDGG